MLHISGIAQDQLFNRWRAQGWRMEIASIFRPDTVVGPERRRRQRDNELPDVRVFTHVLQLATYSI